MAPDPATGKSRGSRYRNNDAHYRGGEGVERDSQRPEMGGKGKGDKESGGTDSGRGVKRRQHGGGVDGSVGATSVSTPTSHRSSKRWRGDGPEASEGTVPVDRWDGGAPDPVKESVVSLIKGKQEMDVKMLDGSTGKVTVTQGKEVMNMEKVTRKQRVARASLASDNRAITVMDLQETDVSIIDSNIRIKNKVSYRREIVAEITESEVEKGAKENAKSTADVRSRRRWDRDGLKGGGDEVEDVPLRGMVGSEGSMEREKRKEKAIWRDRDIEVIRVQNGRKPGEGSRELTTEVGGRPEASDEIDQRSNEWKIQEDLRNVELEKELENRIRRRREESGDRDRWRDDDRERDGKRHSDPREERTRDERHREDYSRRERERHSDRHESRQHREGSRPSEGKPKEDRHYESDREYRSHREERQYGARSKDLDDQGRPERARDQDHRDRKGRDKVHTYDVERRVREKGYKEDPNERDRPHSTTAFVESTEGRSEHRPKRAREGDLNDGFATEREQPRQGVRPGEADIAVVNDFGSDDRPRRSRDDRDDRDPEHRNERPRGSPRETDSLRANMKGSNWRSEGHASDLVREGLPSPHLDTRASPSPNRMDERRSPKYYSQRSPSPPHLDIASGPPRGKAVLGDWLEPSNSVSSSSGTQRRPPGSNLHLNDRRDRMKWLAGAEEEVKSGMHRSNRSTDEGREGSLSPHRLRDQHMLGGPVKPPLHGQDTFSRGIVGRGDRDRWRSSTQGGSGSFEGGQLDHHGPEDLSPRERNERGRRMSMNRPPGSPMLRPQLASLPVPSLAPLPPPPPFRPGIDNPAVLGPPNGGFDDGSCSRDQGRVDRKGGPLRRESGGGIGPGDAWRSANMGNWNSRNQGPLPGNGFPPFPPQFAPHPSSGGGGFPGMGPQFPGPPIFPGGGGRPLMDMGFGGRFLGPGSHMGENGDGFLGPGRGAGWHGPGDGDDGRGPPLMGPVDGWEGPGPHGDDRHRHGRMDWERGGPMGVRVWERDRERELWEGRVREGASDFMPLRSQMEPPIQNTAFPPGGNAWGMPREPQVHSDLKPRPERPPYDIQESKRKPDGVPPKLKQVKSSGRTQIVSEGKRNKYVTATMQSILSQLDISPELAGPEIYAKYRALVPVPESDKKVQATEEEETGSDSADEDLNMEVDIEGEALISGTKLLAKLLPPLPEGVFEAAVRLYRKPEVENKLQKSLVGSFVLPFDPATIELPSIKLKLRSDLSVAPQEEPLAVGAHVLAQQQEGVDTPLISQQDTGVSHLEIGADLSLVTADEIVSTEEVVGKTAGPGSDSLYTLYKTEVAEYEDRKGKVDGPYGLHEHDVVDYENQDGDLGVPVPYKIHDSESAEFEDRERDAIEGEFLPSHVEVAEYSDREFEADMEDNLEEVQQGAVVAEDTDCQATESMEMDEVQEGSAVAEESNCEKSISMQVEGTQLRNLGIEGSQVQTSSPRKEEDFQASAVSEEDSRRDSVCVEAEEVQQEAALGAEVILSANSIPLGSEELKKEPTVADMVRVEDTIILQMEDMHEENALSEETQVENSFPEVDDEKQENAAMEETPPEGIIASDGDATNVLIVGEELIPEQREGTLDETENLPSETVNDFRRKEEISYTGDRGDAVYPQKDSLGIVNIVVETTDDDVGYDDDLVAEGKPVTAEVEIVVATGQKVELEVVLSPEATRDRSVSEHADHDQPLEEITKELSPEASVSDEVGEAAGDIFVHEESVDVLRTPVVEVNESKVEGSIIVETADGFIPVERAGEDFSDAVGMEREGEDEQPKQQDLCDDVQRSDEMRSTDFSEDFPSAVVRKPDHRMESNGKLKEIEEENPSAQEQEPVTVVEVQEPLTMQLRKRRASSRLQANAEAHAQQEAAQGQGSVGVKNKAGGKGAGKRAAKGTTRTSQRRSKRRGSTH